jgi:two-component system OmpR family response regulator
MRILVVEDDPKLRSFLRQGLCESGVECVALEDGARARAYLEGEPDPFDVILLDVMMPVKDGWELLAELRALGNETPVLYVTARDAVEERVKGLRLGADDYIIKPFAFDELLARIEAVVRRRRPQPEHYADLQLDALERTVRRGAQLIELSPREFDLLRVLLAHRERVLTRAQLLHQVWAIDFDPGTNIVDVHVARLRRKLDRPGLVPLVQTVRGEGYRLSSVP